MKPLVSCICPTYGRVPYDMSMLEECVYWFLQQDYPHKELIICNDAATQTLVCDAPGVRVLNLKERVRSLGAKYNFLVADCNGEVVLPWEDDDISLPFRISQSVRHLAGMYEYWNPRGAWFQNGKGTPLTTCSPGNVFHNTSAFKRTLWLEGKCRYDNKLSGPQDAAFNDLATRVAHCNNLRVSLPAEYLYVYRWQHGSGAQPNLSGHGNPARAYAERPEPVPGIYVIEPKMHRDYMRETSHEANSVAARDT